MATVLITGGTGLVGKALTTGLLEKGYSVIILTRNATASINIPGVKYAVWDVANQKIDESAISRADFVIHLAGAGVADKRWTQKRKQEILNSRVQSSTLLVKSIRTIPNKVMAVVSASAIGWYGQDPAVPNLVPFTEEAPADDGFLGNTCRLWEESIEPITATGKRLVKLRMGIVLSKEGGALKEFMKPLRWGIAAIPGNGKQIISWIHIKDLVRVFISVLENEKMTGVYNTVAPQPVSSEQFVKQLARARRSIFIPVKIPAFILKAVLGEMSIEILKSTTVSCKKLLDTGYQFQYPDISSAVSSFK